MKLFVKKNMNLLKDTYEVYDRFGNVKYYVKGETWSLAHKLHILDANKNEIGLIREKVWSLESKFNIEVQGKTLGMIKKKNTWFKSVYEVDFCGWRVVGDFLDYNYDVTEGCMRVASIREKVFTLKDAYEVNIERSQDELYVLMLVLAIDAVKSTESAAMIAAIN